MKKKLKAEVREKLLKEDFASRVKAFSAISKNSFISILLGFIYFDDFLIKWRAISAIAIVVSQLVEEDIESARVIMRRLMWNLNENSGGIGWGSPETMGAIAAKSDEMAHEFGHILFSYANPKGPNYLEYYLLQRGLIWGIGKLAHFRPEIVKKYKNLIFPFLLSDDNTLRGTAIWALGPIKNAAITKKLKKLVEDTTRINIYMDNEIKTVSIKFLVNNALVSQG